MTCIAVYHQAVPTAEGYVAAIRMARIIKDAKATTTPKFCVMLTPGEARQMAKAMRNPYGRFFKKDDDSTVEVWCEEYEGYEITWRRKDGAEIVCEPMNCCEGAYGDGWSWEFAQALDEAADNVEGGQ